MSRNGKKQRQRAAKPLFLGAIADGEAERKPQVLPRGFAELYGTFNDVLDLYHQRKLSTTQLAERLAQLRIEDTIGAEWTLGATSRTWYRRMPGLSWAASEPPGFDITAKGADVREDEQGAIYLPESSGEMAAWRELTRVSSDDTELDLEAALGWSAATGDVSALDEPERDSDIEVGIFTPIGDDVEPASLEELEALLGPAISDDSDQTDDGIAAIKRGWTADTPFPATGGGMFDDLLGDDGIGDTSSELRD